jgi:hypothetical protein
MTERVRIDDVGFTPRRDRVRTAAMLATVMPVASAVCRLVPANRID